MHGINSQSCNNFTFESNIIHNNDRMGLNLLVNNSRLNQNLIYSNKMNGIFLDEPGYNNLISSNQIRDNYIAAMFISGARNSLILNNTCFNNSGAGIRLSHSFTNILKNNSVSFNGDGISIESSYNSYVLENIVLNSLKFGLNIAGNNTYVTGNLVKNSYYSGLFIQEVKYVYITNNTFISNHINPDNKCLVAEYVDNSIYSVYSGNFYHLWVGPDANNDSIVDTPFLITYLKQDLMPRTHMNFLPFHFLSPAFVSCDYQPNKTMSDFFTFNFTWGASVDMYNHSITYSLYLKRNNEVNYTLIVANLTKNSVIIDLKKFPMQYPDKILILSVCSEGLEEEKVWFATGFMEPQKVEPTFIMIFFQIFEAISFLFIVFLFFRKRSLKMLAMFKIGASLWILSGILLIIRLVYYFNDFPDFGWKWIIENMIF
jgi:parallel beta-helix repeat protein